jgi:hypothetical protein
MLRKALDEAENQQRQQEQKLQEEQRRRQQQEQQTERTPLIPPEVVTKQQHHGSAPGGGGGGDNIDDDLEGSDYDEDDDEEDDDDDDDDEEDYLLDDWNTERSSTRNVRETSLLFRSWRAIKNCFMLVVNVENLWDSPTTSQGREITRRNHLVVLFWFFVLAASYTGERTAFKLIVDRAACFRLFAVEMVGSSFSETFHLLFNPSPHNFFIFIFFQSTILRSHLHMH